MCMHGSHELGSEMNEDNDGRKGQKGKGKGKSRGKTASPDGRGGQGARHVRFAEPETVSPTMELTF